jgi:hypothetical protein
MLYKLAFFQDAFSPTGRLAILNANFEFPETPKYPQPLLDFIRASRYLFARMTNSSKT